MGSYLSCESKRSPMPTTPMVAKKWKFSTMTSSDHPNFLLNRPTEIASLVSKHGKRSMLVLEKFGSTTEDTTSFTEHKLGSTIQHKTTFSDDHTVVKLVRNFLPPKLSEHWEVKILRKTDSDVDAEGSDCVCGRTTAVNLVKKGQDLTIGNIGDSRGVLGIRDENDAFVAVMNVDQGDLVVLAPAKVWDELSNGDVQAVVYRSPTRLCAARAVVNAALVGWRNKYKVVDDGCAVVCLFLGSPQESEMRTMTRLHICSRPEQFVERVWL
ncbi:probable protein phosphatase 2C 18 [Salvia hispanica]|uniref:probable protein phosphatase 2C 18 n=1 Tax=Salvia hispanica TaxID=49212 RepID=UPI0020092175|nr:probable protein phosphatase 2C 18 [Salvia hispanica]XP_047955449.1 probable protein phosphatase 2C 18 [Salvia hispanica]